jgi:putative membrane-bound dehydrogenase-like protein
MNCRFARTAALLAALVATAWPAHAQTAKPLRVFIAASEKTHGPGEHDYPRFLQDWIWLLMQRGALASGELRFPTPEELDKSDVLVLYASDGHNLAPGDQRQLERFLQRGGGLVALHDAICGTNAAWFKTVAGGAKVHGETNWSRGLTGLYFQDYAHPITEGVANFDLNDESFFKLQLMPEVKVLATTFHTAKEIVPQMWTYEPNPGRAFVSLQGHYYTNFSQPHYRGLLLRGIAWAGKRAVNTLLRADELVSFRYPAGGPTAPGEAAKKIRVSPTFDLSLVAAEPLVVNPIALDWDARGRLWLAVTPEYPFKEDKSPGRDAILILEDTNRDGQMDRRSVFADGLVLPTSFVFHRDGVIVSQAPQILFLRDTNGDGKADKREVLFSGFGTYDTHAVINNLRWGLDGWVYGCQGYSGTESTNIANARGQRFGKIGNGIFRFQPDGRAIEQVASYSGNSWGMDFNAEGELFFSMANGPHLSHVVMPERYLARGKLGNATSSKAIEDHQKVSPIFTDQRHEYVQVAPVGVFTAASGCTIYEGGAWPEKYHGSAFVCEPTVHIVHEDIVTRAESPTYEATRRDDAEFIAGTDLWFRPVHTRVGPDGAMYLLDFYNQAISHNDIRGIAHGKGNAAVRPDRDHQHGRLWRIQHKQARGYDAPPLAAATAPQLAAALAHPNAWVRLTAQRLLVERRDQTAAPAVAAMLDSRLALARLHALWTLHLLDALPATNLIAALADAHPAVQNNALRLVPELRVAPSSNVVAAVLKLLKDTSERTRLDAVLALTQWEPGKETISATHKLFYHLRDAKESWTKSAILGVARRAPTNFIRAAFASDQSEHYRALVAPLVEDFIHKRDAGVTAWILTHAARQASSTDKLKIHVLQTFAKHVGDYAPPFSTNIDAALRTFLKSESRSMRIAAFPLVSHYDTQGGHYATELQALRRTLLAELDKEKVKDEDRNAYITTLMTVESMWPETISKLDALIEHGASKDVQKHIIVELGKTTSPLAAAVLLRNYSRFNTENKQLAVGTLLKRGDWALGLLSLVEKKTIPLNDLGVQTPGRLLTHPDATVAGRAARVLEALRGPQTREKDALITKFQAAFIHPADQKNGKELFEKNCAVCHKFGDKGKDAGPNLTGAGLHGEAVLLTHILDPNRVVEGNFISYNVLTKKDEEYTGLIKTENTEKIVLKNLEGELELRRADIVSMKSSGLSLMPDGLEALGEKNIRDIVGYLAATVPKGFRPLNLSSAFTADSRKGLYAVQNDSPSLAFKQFGIVMVDNIPFDIVNPAATSAGKNVIVLKGGDGFARTLPQRVEFPVGTAAKKIYVLGGVAGWGFPYGEPDLQDVPAAKARLEYADGKKEEIIWKNGEEFADYMRPYEVPGSRSVGGLTEAGQLRWFAIVPKRQAVIKQITLESFNNHLAPTFVSMTAQVD